MSPRTRFLARLRRLRDLDARPWIVKAEQVNLVYVRDLARGLCPAAARDRTLLLYEIHVRPLMGKE